MDTTLVLGGLNKTVAEMAEFLEAELEQAEHHAELDLLEGGDTVLMDERFLKQALLNLVKNSMHAMATGGKLSFRTKRVSDAVTFQLADTGSGIPATCWKRSSGPSSPPRISGLASASPSCIKCVKEHGADIQVRLRRSATGRR